MPYDLELDDEPPLPDALVLALAPALFDELLAGYSTSTLVAGGDWWSDVFDWVRRLASFPVDMAGWLWDRFVDTWDLGWRIVNDIVDWSIIIINYVIDKAGVVVGALGTAVWEAAAWIVNAIPNAAAAIWEAVTWVVNTLWDVIQAIAGAAWDAVKWAAKFLWDAIQAVANAIWEAVTWVVNTLWDVIQTIAGAAWDAVRWVLDQLWAGLRWLFDQLWAGARWLWDQVRPGFQFVTEQVFNYVVQGAQAIGEGFLEGLRFFIEEAFSPFTDLFSRRAAGVRRLWAAGYDSFDELIEDFVPALTGGSIQSFIENILGQGATLAAASKGIAEVYAENSIQKALFKLRPTIPTLTVLERGFLRGVLDPGLHDNFLGSLGFSPKVIDVVKQLYFDVPPPSDLILMAVREAFDDNVAAQFGTDAAFPAEFATYGRQIGIDADWAKRYWRAHWNLPSTEQGFEMFHRDRLSLEQLQLLLRVKDITPFWQDRLVQIAYNVPGRIDLRRMFAAGVVDEPRVLRGYLDLGYNPDDARTLTDFAVKLAGGADKDLPRGTILKAYSEGVLSRAAAAGALDDLGFDEAGIELMLDLEDLKLAEEDRDLAEDIVEADYKAGAISEASARQSLAELGVPSARIDLLIKRWTRRAAVRIGALNVSQILRAFRESVLDAGAVRGRLAALGFNEADVAILLELSTPEPAAKEAPELTIAQLRQAFREDLIDEAELRRRLDRKGFTAADVELLFQLATPDPDRAEAAELTKADLRALFRANLIDDQELTARLTSKGLALPDVELLVHLYSRAAA